MNKPQPEGEQMSEETADEKLYLLISKISEKLHKQQDAERRMREGYAEIFQTMEAIETREKEITELKAELSLMLQGGTDDKP